ncbi:MAG: 50S ribosomal protein L3 [Bacteroidota bacterium]
MQGIIGKKIQMTSKYDDKGRLMACTLVEAGPCVITQLRTQEKDGYEAIQLGYEEKKAKNTTRPLQKHFEKAKVTPKKKLIEFRDFAEEYSGSAELNLGATLKLEDIFAQGEKVNVVGYSKGKGFQGVVKRHGFSGVNDKTHGQHNRERAPGAIGACATPSRVFKGMRMAGQTGGQRVKVKNLEILKIIPEHHLILLKGAIPGARNGYIILEK